MTGKSRWWPLITGALCAMTLLMVTSKPAEAPAATVLASPMAAPDTLSARSEPIVYQQAPATQPADVEPSRSQDEVNAAVPRRAASAQADLESPLEAEAAIRRMIRELVVHPPPPPPALVGKALIVDQSAQVLRVYEDGVQVRALLASTGVPPDSTPEFLGRVGWYMETIYGYGGWADHAWFITSAASGNIWIHGAPYTYVDGRKVYEGIESLGAQPSSHGCIRIHPDDADWLLAWNPRDAPILITPLNPSGK